MKLAYLLVPVAICVVLVYFCLYTVDEREQVVITQFGKPIGEPIKDPGIKTKLPYQVANKFPKNLLEWDGDPGQIPTYDKKFIYVDTFARWRIVDPLKYFQTVINETGAQARLDDIIDSAVYNFVTSYLLIETVRTTNRELEISTEGSDGKKEELSDLTIETGRAAITKGILEQAQPKMEKFGIEIVDVKIKRLNYEEAVRRSVYERMIAERNQIAEKYRSEGQGEARKIEGDREREMKKITSEAYKSAQEIMGKADEKATAIYASAYGKDPDFYSFIQTLEIYKGAMDKNSTLVLSTDSEFLKYFQGYKGE